jgi:CspA family cold shock protein
MTERKIYKGEVDWFNPEAGYGFITWEGDKDMFVHFSDILTEGYKTLKKGQKIEFEIGENNVGKPKAVEVNILNEE